MRYQIHGTLVATGLFAMTAMGNPVLAIPPGGGSSIMLAQATPAPVAQAPAPTAVPGQMMEHGREMGKGMGPMMNGQGHPGPMGGMPPCPAGQSMSGTPPACK